MARHSKAKSRAKKQKATAAMAHTDHPQYHLTMLQEARNTEGRNLWRVGTNLRHQAVRFVSASGPQSDQEEGSNLSEIDTQLQETSIEPDRKEAKHTPEREKTPDDMTPLNSLISEMIVHTTSTDPAAELRSPDHDDSSEDEVVFPGRHKQTGPIQHIEVEMKKTAENTLKHSSIIRQGKAAEHGELRDPTRSAIRTKMLPVLDIAPSTKVPQEKPPPDLDDDENFISLKTNKSFTKHRKSQMLIDDEDDILADYIANMDNDYEESDYMSDLNPEPGPKAGDSKINMRTTSSSSASSVASDDSELPLRKEVMPSRSGRISPAQECKDRHPSSTESTERRTKVVNQKGTFDDMLYTLLNYSGDSLSPSESDGSEKSEAEEYFEFESGSEAQNMKGTAFTRSQRKRDNLETGIFASATAFADALESDPYYGFDIMDFNRPSLQKKTKGKNRAFHFGVSDSELELELENAWQNDRQKKKNRKQKREELRSQGLLGRSTDNPDLKAKFSNGMGISDLKLEIRVFLLSPKDSLHLPPMTKQRRKLVHDLAGALSLKSQSRGKGLLRFPILHKTSRTPKYTQRTIHQVDQIFSKGKFSHRTIKSWEQKSSKSSKPGRGRPDASVSYMDGDIVGASAPEIGAGNKGRAMLERMGWSTGTALGATNNKGILLPVAHVVKNSKAGLG